MIANPSDVNWTSVSDRGYRRGVANRDELIGQNLSRIRGGVSQAELAREMKDRGFKWSQATVWAVEKGERPLRLAEAVALMEILDLERVEELLALPVTFIFFQALTRYLKAENEAHAAAMRWFDAGQELARRSDLVVAESGAEELSRLLASESVDWADNPGEVFRTLRHEVEEMFASEEIERARKAATKTRSIGPLERSFLEGE